jgi:hypothetical protein
MRIKPALRIISHDLELDEQCGIAQVSCAMENCPLGAMRNCPLLG